MLLSSSCLTSSDALPFFIHYISFLLPCCRCYNSFWLSGKLHGFILECHLLALISLHPPSHHILLLHKVTNSHLVIVSISKNCGLFIKVWFFFFPELKQNLFKIQWKEQDGQFWKNFRKGEGTNNQYIVGWHHLDLRWITFYCYLLVCL